MADKELEQRLGEFDFSQLSPAREPLLQRLLFLKRAQGRIAAGHESLWERQLDDGELEMAAAAGNPALTMKPEITK